MDETMFEEDGVGKQGADRDRVGPEACKDQGGGCEEGGLRDGAAAQGSHEETHQQPEGSPGRHGGAERHCQAWQSTPPPYFPL